MKNWYIVQSHTTFENKVAQLIKEELLIPFVQLLAIVIFMKNAMTVINTSTPYQAVLGRQPAMLPPIEGGHNAEFDDKLQSQLSSQRHHARVREVAAINMIEVLAKMRMQRADRSRSRGAINLKEIKSDDLVDIWIKPEKKGVEGWRGPGQVVQVNAEDGNVSVRYQGRIRDGKAQEVRLHVPYLVFLSVSTPHLEQWRIIKEYTEKIPYSSSHVFGIILMEDNTIGWHLTKRSTTVEGKKILEAGMILSNIGSYMEQSCRV